ncbi:type II toxin-antitoxin system RelE/ParE family toxin [Alkalimonas delamerensis]|uniref:Type II toxin-antitoxin system RelE/ParE family toxin n=1 Tax=Alkalimonas delamerensis TaxID=265981 RepID=A0ABT9GNB7_9GAMM|nr:type II toxin-antitoxin system RelE/ParE family toxin [Alkalimonas delamerensis]MDP4528472.1 type II toxin-antitoxin system RelE/ParE family toxin [Alkalimonas delamerensis]
MASAREDIRQEKSRYRSIHPELARRFQAAIEAATALIAEQPLAMQELDFSVRRWPLETFPHGVLYRVEEKYVLVLAVFHPSREPEKWHLRVRT